MITFEQVGMILLVHWVADFVCQTDKMARGKSKSNKMLFLHVAAYCTVLLAVIPVFELRYSVLDSLLIGIGWSLVNGVLHFCTDWVTSRVTSRLWEQGKVHEFFVVVGLDQYLHAIALIGTFVLVTNYIKA